MDNLAVPLVDEVRPEETAANTGFVSVGEQLRLAREKHGWSRLQVAQRLNVTERYIEYLESDAFDKLPRATFTRGYLKNYARCAGLSATEIVCGYEQQTGAAVESLKPARTNRFAHSVDPALRTGAILSVLIFVLTSVLWWQSQQNEPSTVTPETVAVVEVDNVAGETLVETQDLSAPEQGRNAAETAPGFTRSAAHRLTVTFEDSSWLEVQGAEGQLLFSGVRKAGETLRLASPAPLEVVIGNAEAVKLSYNNAPVEMAGHIAADKTATLTLGG